MSTKLLDLVNITKSYDGVTILDDLNLYIRENEFLTLLGPSGCGKSSLKNCDEIIVMDHGQISQRGSFDGLLSQPGIFGDMYYGRLK